MKRGGRDRRGWRAVSDGDAEISVRRDPNCTGCFGFGGEASSRGLLRESSLVLFCVQDVQYCKLVFDKQCEEGR